MAFPATAREQALPAGVTWSARHAAIRWRALRRRLLLYGGATLLGAWTLFPFYWALNMSVMYKDEIVSVPAHLYPHLPTGTNFLQVIGLPAYGVDGALLPALGQSPLLRLGLRNSFMIALPVTLATLAVSLPMAYALGRLQFKNKTGVLMGLLMSRTAPPVATTLPLSWLFYHLGLLGTSWGLMVAYLTGTIPLATWIMSGVFSSLPRNIESAARVDGLTRFGTFRAVLLPVAMPGVVACGAIAFILCWDDFALAYLLGAGAPAAQTFPPVMEGLMNRYANTGAFAAVWLLGTLPPMLLALAFQRRIRSINIVNPL